MPVEEVTGFFLEQYVGAYGSGAQFTLRVEVQVIPATRWGLCPVNSIVTPIIAGWFKS